MEKALYSLTAILFGNILIGWGKSIYGQFNMYKQLMAELTIIQSVIRNNCESLTDTRSCDNEFPLLIRIELPIHEKLMSNYILESDIATHATKLLGHCKHYNRIIDLGEKKPSENNRKNEVMAQGALISNIPEIIPSNQNKKTGTFSGHSKKYYELLEIKSKKTIRGLKYFPWYLIMFYNYNFEDMDQLKSDLMNEHI